jgi:hypothetical protein
MEGRPFLRVKSVFLALLLAAVPNAQGQSKEQKREAVYQAAVQSYSEVLKPGMTRKDVENYLRAKGTPYVTTCCVVERSASTVLVRIGKEKHPWYCSEHVVYIAFVLIDEPHSEARNSNRPSDVLKSITVYHQLEGCL